MKYFVILAAISSCDSTKCLSSRGAHLMSGARLSCEEFQAVEDITMDEFSRVPSLAGFRPQGLAVVQHTTDVWQDPWLRQVSGLAYCPNGIDIGPSIVIPHEYVHMARGCTDESHADWVVTGISVALNQALERIYAYQEAHR
jgi:hypothetical protein